MAIEAVLVQRTNWLNVEKAIKNLKDIEILKDLIVVTLDREVTEPLKISVLDALSAETGQYGNCRVEISGNRIKLYNLFNISNPFSTVEDNAKKWQAIIEAKRKKNLQKRE